MRLQHLFHRIMAKAIITIPFSALICLLVPDLAAQQQNFRVVPEQSTARLFVGTRANPKSFNLAVGRVSGLANIDPDSLETSSFSFNVYAANESPAGDVDNQALAGEQPVISFQSQHVTERGNGALQVDGQLTVTVAEHEVEASAGEDYSGQRGTTRLVAAKHAAVFIFVPLAVSQGSSAEPADDPLLNAHQLLPETRLLLAATTTVNGEAFPELSQSIETVAWPPATSDAHCTMPNTAGEDYSGLQCTERVVAPFPSQVLLPTEVGEDYSGIQVETTQGNQVTIELRLVLTGANRSTAASREERLDTNGKTTTAMQAVQLQ